MKQGLLATLFFVFAASSAGAQEIAGSPAKAADSSLPFKWGVMLEGHRSETYLSAASLTGKDWRLNPIPGAATSDPNENADYVRIRDYSGLQGFIEFEPISDMKLTGHVKLGQLREVFKANFEPGSFFVDWDENGEVNAIAPVGSVYLGAGASVSYSIDKIRILGDLDFGYNQTSYANQRWFDLRSNGSIYSLGFELRGGVSYSLGFLTPRAYLGYYSLSASGKFYQILANQDRNARFEAEFGAVTPLTLSLGAEFGDGEKVLGSIDVVAFGEYAMRFTAGMRF